MTEAEERLAAIESDLLADIAKMREQQGYFEACGPLYEQAAIEHEAKADALAAFYDKHFRRGGMHAHMITEAFRRGWARAEAEETGDDDED